MVASITQPLPALALRNHITPSTTCSGPESQRFRGESWVGTETQLYWTYRKFS